MSYFTTTALKAESRLCASVQLRRNLESFKLTRNRKHKLIIRINGLGLLLFLVFMKTALAADAQRITEDAQRITLSRSNAPLREVLTDIHRQTGFVFLFTAEMMKDAKPVNVQFKNLSLDDALQECIAGQFLAYTINDKTVVLRRVASPMKQVTVIRGKVTDEQNIPLKGASIVLSGTSKGTVTDAKGEFELNGSVGDELLISSIGYETQKVIVSEQTQLAITLKSATGSLNDVVVIGYGSVKQKSVTGAVSKVNASDMALSTASNFTQALQGEAPGVQAMQPTGQPGANVRVQIRTNPSNASSGVLYVIDGVPVNDAAGDPGTTNRYGASGVDPSPFNFINPNDIESIQFLKDASAASIYGARAGGGVILITTKRGKSGKAKLDYSLNLAFQSPDKLYALLNTKDYMKQYNLQQKEVWLMDNHIAPFYGDVDESTVNPYTPKFSQTQIDTTPENKGAMDVITRKGFMQQHNLALSGGNGKTTYFVSGNYFTQKGVVIGSGYTRYNGRVNFDQVLSDHFKVGVNVITSNSVTDNVNTGGQYEQGGIFTAALYHPPYLPFQDEDGSYPVNPQYPNIPNPLSYSTVTDQTKSSRLLTNGYAEWRILPGLSAKANFSYDQSDAKRYAYQPKTFLYGAQAGGVASVSQNSVKVSLTEYTLNYSHIFGVRHSLNLLAGYSYQNTMREGINAGNQNFITDGFLYNALQSGQAPTPVVGSSKSQVTWASYFARGIYTFDNKYTLAATVRRDGSSIFAANKKYGVFPSVSAGWIISDESFMKNIRVINSLKLRAGYGATGNSNIAGTAFSFYNAGGNYNYVFGGTQAIGVQLSQLNNDDLTWETDAELNIGLDFEILNGRISGSVDYFNKKISNLLALVPLQADFLVNSIWQNSGTTKASGYEIGLSSRNVISNEGGFEWKTMLTFSHYYSYWLERSPDALKTLSKYVGASGRDAPFNGIYGYIGDGIYQGGKSPDQMPDMTVGGIILKDIHGYDSNGNLTGPDGLITGADQTLLGNNDPKFNFGLGNTFRYKSLDLSVYFYGSKQEKFNTYKFFKDGTVNYGWNSLEKKKESWSHLNTQGSFPSAIGDNTYGDYQFGSSYYLSDASFVRCKDITVGYSLPGSLIKSQNIFSSLRVSVSAQNLFTITSFPEQDPELSPNGDGRNSDWISNYYPLVRSFVIGINASF